MNNSAFTSLSLKIIGLILIISSVLDYIILAIPFQITEPQWQIGFAGQVVNQGAIPMVGIAFVLAAYWIDYQNNQEVSGINLKFPIFILSAFLGLVFLLIVPLHLNNLNNISKDALERIAQEANAAQGQVQAEIQAINSIVQDPNRLNEEIQKRMQALASAQNQQLNAQQQRQVALIQNQTQFLQQIQQAKNGDEKNKILKKFEQEKINELQGKKEELDKKAKQEAFKQGLKTGLSSLMLAIGYGAIGALGLRGVSSSPGRRDVMR